MAFELAQSVGFWGRLEALKHNLVDVPGRPAAEAVAALQQNFKQPEDAGLMELDTRITGRADEEGQGKARRCAVTERSPRGRSTTAPAQAGEPIRDRQALGAHGLQVVGPFPEAKVAQVI